MDRLFLDEDLAHQQWVRQRTSVFDLGITWDKVVQKLLA
jgi:hypothetical protein